MKIKAAIAVAAGEPLEVDEIDLEGPKDGEVLIELKATGVCHTDAYTLSGADPEGIFPSVLGHEGAGVVVEVGRGVTSLEVGDHVIPLYIPECRKCKYCLSQKTNLCQAVRATQGKGLMPDGTSRLSRNGKPIYHFMGTSTFATHSVVPEISVAKIRKDAKFDSACLLGLRNHHRCWCRSQHCQSRTRCQCGRLRPRRRRIELHPRRTDERCLDDHRC